MFFKFCFRFLVSFGFVSCIGLLIRETGILGCDGKQATFRMYSSAAEIAAARTILTAEWRKRMVLMILIASYIINFF